MELIRDIWLITLGVLFLALIVIAAVYRRDLENHPRMGMIFMIIGFVSTFVFFGGIFTYLGAALLRSILAIFA